MTVDEGLREIVLDALRRLQADRIASGVSTEDPDDGVDEFTDQELTAITHCVKWSA